MEHEPVSVFEYEKEMTKYERKERRLLTWILLLMGLWFGTNAVWILHFIR